LIVGILEGVMFVKILQFRIEINKKEQVSLALRGRAKLGCSFV